MVKKHYRLFWVCALMIVAFSGCDSTNNVDPKNLQLTITANPTKLLAGEYSLITVTLNNVDTSVATGTSATATTPVSGYAVTFKITQNISNCTFTVVNNITDALGNATAIYQAGYFPGIDIIQASIDSGQTTSASITVSLTATQ
jgi:hypothetical protein